MRDKKNVVIIKFGGMADPIHEQLKAMGVPVKKSDVSHFQTACDGLVQLKILGCIGYSYEDKIAKRLAKQIVDYANKKLSNLLKVKSIPTKE